MALYVLRHGETLWNRERRFQGRLDSALTERGRDQARRYGLTLRRLLGERMPDLAASPLGRAVETMRLACDAAGWDPGRCRLDPDLREISLGDYDGLTAAEIPNFEALRARHAAFDSFFFHCPGGESWDEAVARLDRALARFDPAAETVVFLHGVSGKLLRGRALGLEPASILALDTPQDAFHRLDGSRAERVAAAETDSAA
jgi:broad specificity phosphatase PhoE